MNVKNGLIPDVHSYGVTMDGFCKTEKIEECESFFAELLKQNVKPNAVKRKMIEAFTLHDDMMRKEFLQWIMQFRPCSLRAKIFVSGMKKEGLML
ncbi:hypothetical protein Leryth_018781 [Lithospermum erythrorhizon]|nr:hypothetical protein Leryth_018781 [Lithospermum erythrorhizon]